MVRGEVFRVKAPRNARGREQRGARLGVIVQADELLALSTVLVAPTSRSAQPSVVRPAIEVGGEMSRVMVEQTTAMDHGRLGPSVGRLSAPELRSVDEALTLVLGL